MKLLLQHPVAKPSINQGFGPDKTAPEMLPKYQAIGLIAHNGIDYYAPDGTPIMAMHDGTVTYAGLDGSNGNLVSITTDEMYDYKDTQYYYRTLYGHLKTGKIFVTVGDKVKVGQVIAHADNTGMSTGSHLHVGLKVVKKGEAEWDYSNVEQGNGYNAAIDPSPYLPEHQEFTVDLKFGDIGFEVEKMQAFLVRNKYMRPVSSFGFYGEITSKALLDFQIKNVKISWYERYILKGSKFGPKTRAAFNKFSTLS